MTASFLIVNGTSCSSIGSSRSVRSRLMDPYAWSLSLRTNWRSGSLRLRGHFSFVSVSKIVAWRGKHDEPSRTSVVLDLRVHLGRDPSYSCHYTLQLGTLTELLNDQAVCDVLMSINSVSDQGLCLTLQ